MCFGMTQDDKVPATQTDEGVVEAGAGALVTVTTQQSAPGNVYNIC